MRIFYAHSWRRMVYRTTGFTSASEFKVHVRYLRLITRWLFASRARSEIRQGNDGSVWSGHGMSVDYRFTEIKCRSGMKWYFSAHEYTGHEAIYQHGSSLHSCEPLADNSITWDNLRHSFLKKFNVCGRDSLSVRESGANSASDFPGNRIG